MLRKLADSVILHQADANLINWRKLLTEQRTNALGKLGERQVPEACGKRSKSHSPRPVASRHA